MKNTLKLMAMAAMFAFGASATAATFSANTTMSVAYDQDGNANATVKKTARKNLAAKKTARKKNAKKMVKKKLAAKKVLKIKSLATKKQLSKNNHNTHFGKLLKFAKVGYNQLFRIFAPLINLLV